MLKITHANGVFYTVPGFIQEPDRLRLKGQGFRFHWEQGSDKCRRDCLGCKLGLPDKVWYQTNHVRVSFLSDVLDEEAIEAIAQWAGQAENSRKPAADIKIPKPDELEADYFPYQKAAILYALGRKRVLFADSMGLGKSIEAIGWINALRAEGQNINRILIICPASLKINWGREMQRWLVGGFSDFPVWVAMGIDDRDAAGLRDFFDKAPIRLVIVNYELLVRTKELSKALMSYDWSVIIIDEAHRLKNLSAQRSQVILGRDATKNSPAVPGLVDKAERIAALTGTPMPNRPREFYPLARLMDPETFAVEWAYLQRYCGARKVSFWKKNEEGVPEEKFRWDFSGASNLSELRELCRAKFMVRRLKKDVWQEMPEKTRQVVVLWPPKEVAAVDFAIDEKLRQTTIPYEQAHDALMSPQGAKILAEIAKEREELALLKLPFAIEFIELAIESTNKVVVFAHHHSVIEALKKHFKKRCVVLYGPMSEKRRQKSVDRFQQDKTMRLFIGSSAAGEGITLTASSHVIFVESSWVPGEVSQREDRVHRVGQTTNRVLIQHLVWDGTIEAYMIQRVIEKQAVINQAMDGKR